MPNKIKLVLKLAWVFGCLVFAGCSEDKWNSTLESVSTAQVTGKALMYTPSGSSFKVGTSSVTTLSCSSLTASLYEILADGTLSANPIVTSAVDSNGVYNLRVKGLGVDARSDNLKYVVKISGCDEEFTRPVTGYRDQDVSFSSTLLFQSTAVQDASAKKLNNVEREDTDELLTRLSHIGGSDIAELFTNALADANLKQAFETIFGLDMAKLADSAPRVTGLGSVMVANELSGAAFSVTATHWHPDYDIVYLWKLDGTNVSTAANYTFTPGKNQQGAHSISLYVGKDDGSGAVDLTKAYLTEAFSIQVNDTYPATPVNLTLSAPSAPTLPGYAKTVSIGTVLATGAGLASCASFSGLAATIDQGFPSLLPSDYSLICSSAPSQSFNFTLTDFSQGSKVLELWARDSSGNLSAAASTVSVVFDSVAPVPSVSVGSPLKGGTTVNVTLGATDATSGVQSLELFYAQDGIAFSSLASLAAGATSYSWMVPTSNTGVAKLKLVAVDRAGNSDEALTAIFTIDSTDPGAPAPSLVSPAFSNSPTVQFNVANCTDTAFVLSNEGAQPAAGDSGWQVCDTGATYNQTVTGEGVHTVKVWAKDAVGNISATAGTVTMTYDTSDPSVTLTSLTGGEIISGRTGQSPAINSRSITWTASDGGAGLTANPISLSYSIDGGVNWLVIASSLANSGTYTWTVPAIDDSDVRLRVSAADNAGNTGTSSSGSNLTVDSTPPAINSAAGQSGSAVSQPFINIVSSVSDAVAGTLQIQIRDGVATPDSSLWVNHVSPLGLNFNFVQGSHTLYYFVRDQAGNLNQTSFAITLDTGTPPTVNILSPAVGASFPAGTSQTIGLHVHDVELPMPSNSVVIQFSVNNGSTWTSIGTAHTPYSNSAVLTNETLSVTWNPVPAAVTGKAVLFRIMSADSAGNSVTWTSNFYNTPTLSRVAGGITDANGNSARYTVFNASEYYTDYRLSMFARDPITNDIFIGDLSQGLRYINGATGIVSLAPTAGGTPVVAITRDNFGKIYGCTGSNIYVFNRTNFAWDMFLAGQGCSMISAWKTQPNKFYYVRGNRLYYYDGTSFSWVAFNGTSNGAALPTDYPLAGDPKLSLFPKVQAFQFAVNTAGDAVINDFCNQNGTVPSCGSRYVTYERVNNGLSVANIPSNGRLANLTFRTSNETLIGMGRGIYDEDPFTGQLFKYAWSQVKQYPANQALSITDVNTGYHPVNETNMLGVVAGVLRDGGDGGLATEAHLESSLNLAVGLPGSADMDSIFVPRGFGCCWAWGSWRKFTVGGNISLFTATGNYTRQIPFPVMFASTGQGMFDWYGNFYRSNGVASSNRWGGTQNCLLSPTDGTAANANNWPRIVAYNTNYASGLHHSDGYVYLAGFRNNVNPGGGAWCTGTSDIYIKRFSFNNTTFATGTVQHVAGNTGAPAGSEPVGNGQDASNFAFGNSIIAQMRENRNAGGNGNIFFIQGTRVRVIDRVDPATPGTWKIYDVTKTIAGLKGFVIDGNVNALGTSGFLYYATGDSNIYKYHLGTGTVALSDDTVETVAPGGLTGLAITGIDILSNGHIVFTDNKTNGAVYKYSP